ncbi:MAG: AAA family ATPase [Thermoleophilaceae bacterium]
MLAVRVLGELALELDGTPVDPPSSRRACSLLGALALEPRAHARSELAARFWPDVLDESARTSLRAALSALRRSLGADADRYLVATRDRVGLAEGTEVWTDAAEFGRLAESGRRAEALELWRGDVLAGLDDEWILAARDEWRERVSELLALLATEAEEAGDMAAALTHTRRMTALDPLVEESQRELIRRLAASGDRAAALRAYERHAERLRTELRIVPSAATRALVEDLRAETPAAAGQPAPAAGTVTLLFTDLVGSTELLERLGDDEAERLRRVHFGLLREVALSHAGQEVKNLGDGLMVAFGGSLDAAACAIGIQQAVHRHSAREGHDWLQVRVGLNVGEPIRDEGDYFGTPVVVAKRLCDRAEGGQILASDLVPALIGNRGGFGFRPVGELALKGISRPVAACELAWEPVGEQRVPLPADLAREQGEFVGREAPLGRLERAWAEASAGHPGVVAVAGEPGIGKTRLVAQLCCGAHERGATVLLGRSYEEPLIPYGPFVEALRHYVAACPPDELRLQVGARRGVLARLVPELAGGAEPDGRREDPEGERYLLFDAVASLLREASRTRPMILVLDDLHWADSPSLLLLRHVARAAQDVPLLVLGTYRETEVDRDHPLAGTLAELRRARMLETISLSGLEPGDVAALIRARTDADVDQALAGAVAERTEGNPFFVEEIVRHLDEEGELAVPESVKDLVLRRLRRLDEPARRALATAAVIGREFELEAVARATGTSDDDVLDLMERAIGEHAVVESPDVPGRYAFAHALIRETIEEQLSATRRARLHRRVGEALEGLHAGHLEEHAGALARHFAAAGEAERSFEYRCTAAATAARAHAVEAAVKQYGEALELGAQLGLVPSGDARIRRLHADRGWMRHVVGDTEAARADYGTALEAARAAGDRQLEMEALNLTAVADMQFDAVSSAARHRAALEIAQELGDETAQVSILSRLALVHSNQLDLTRALEDGESALGLARKTGDDRDLARALDGLKLAALKLGDVERLEALTRELGEIERRDGDLWYLQWTLLESSFAPLASTLWDDAAQRLEEALAINRRIGDALTLPLIRDATGWLARSQGHYEQALAAGRSAVEAATAGTGWKAWTCASLGWTMLDLGAAGDARELLEAGAESAATRSDRYRVTGHLAWARWLGDDPEGAAEAAGVAEDLLASTAAPPGGAFLFGFGATVALGRFHAAAGRPERGEELLAPVLAAAERSGWHEAAGSAALVLGLCREGGGHQRAAADLFSRARDISARHGLPGIEWEALAASGRTASGDDAKRLQADSRGLVERLAAGVGDDRLAEGLRAAR